MKTQLIVLFHIINFFQLTLYQDSDTGFLVRFEITTWTKIIFLLFLLQIVMFILWMDAKYNAKHDFTPLVRVGPRCQTLVIAVVRHYSIFIFVFLRMRSTNRPFLGVGIGFKLMSKNLDTYSQGNTWLPNVWLAICYANQRPTGLILGSEDTEFFKLRN